MKMRTFLGKALTFLAVSSILLGTAAAQQKPKVLYINPYHKGYAWGDGELAGAESVLRDNVDLKVVYMDTKRNNTEEFCVQAGIKVRDAIESYNPDVVIAADDISVKYVIAPFYKYSYLPVVLCGVQWDYSEYGFSTRNVTGIVQVSPVDGLVNELKKVSGIGPSTVYRVGFLAPDTGLSRAEAAYVQKVFKIKLDTYFAKDFKDWKKGFFQLQENVTMLVLDSDRGLYGRYEKELVTYAKRNTRVPTGTCYGFMTPAVLLTYLRLPSEFGEWAGKAALKIIHGKLPAEVLPGRNKQGAVIVNLGVAKNAGIRVPLDIVANAQKVID